MTLSNAARRRAVRLGATATLALALASMQLAAAPADVPVDGARRCDSAASDQRTAAAVLARLQWNVLLDATDINVAATGGRVELWGLARSEAQKTLAGSLALDTYGAASLSNQIDVNDWSPHTETAQLTAATRQQERLARASQSDRWLSAAVSYTLSFSQTIASCAIAVSASNSIVELRGTAVSASARLAAIAAAENTIGVRSVDAVQLVVAE
ncbi:osmotically-inducible protein OsmY [Tahibacter aquaticus]|uniref:Osmotically-inducible protein OsmY n=1 Tax=Tahibacter aquaticus TaxID=520092 RepID=A0A4R6YWA7_9GAMM|nr:BON domain-containing protein [Tahibacter aquaticus]TDR43110.1 osmotically-inducible protein OsmY [Tahibacter aquaticus]